MCENCSVVFRGRLANCLKRRLRNVGAVEDFSEALGECVSSAREIIGTPAGRKASCQLSEGDECPYSELLMAFYIRR
jgi:hypothetical protein